jgi:hypothetical protein
VPDAKLKRQRHQRQQREGPKYQSSGEPNPVGAAADEWKGKIQNWPNPEQVQHCSDELQNNDHPEGEMFSDKLWHPLFKRQHGANQRARNARPLLESAAHRVGKKIAELRWDNR